VTASLRRTAVGLLAVAATSAFASALPQIPRSIVSVRNTTNVALTCKLQLDGNATETLVIAPGQELQRRVVNAASGGSMTCAAPVKRVQFRLAPGRRYVLIRSMGKEDSVRLPSNPKSRFYSGTIDLRDVTGS
jgi:hypothetical protein